MGKLMQYAEIWDLSDKKWERKTETRITTVFKRKLWARIKTGWVREWAQQDQNAS